MISVRRSPLILLLLLLASCTDPSAKLPNYGHVPHFQLIDSVGKPFDSAQLDGKVWIADFIFTNCPGPCPMMTSRMHRLQETLKDEADVRFVSISVDPANDTPAAMNAFANKFHGPAPDWFFLTGSPETIHMLARWTFKMGDLIPKLDHSTRFALVDKHGNVRGYYSSDNDAEIGTPALMRDIELLRRQKS